METQALQRAETKQLIPPPSPSPPPPSPSGQAPVASFPRACSQHGSRLPKQPPHGPSPDLSWNTSGPRKKNPRRMTTLSNPEKSHPQQSPWPPMLSRAFTVAMALLHPVGRGRGKREGGSKRARSFVCEIEVVASWCTRGIGWSFADKSQYFCCIFLTLFSCFPLLFFTPYFINIPPARCRCSANFLPFILGFVEVSQILSIVSHLSLDLRVVHGHLCRSLL